MIGKVIGNYQITSELAHGGMGSVYRGRHLNLPREVVVKVIKLAAFPPSTQEHLRARFRREAYIQSQLDHPGIVRVYEFFTTEENYFLIMEFVAGMSLRDLIGRQRALPPAQAAGLLKQALAALSYAHQFAYVDESGREQRGLVHRDIKPANLLLDGRARLKLTDFGIVKVAGEGGMTQTGFNPSTIEYASPEQLRGLSLDPRSDLYSLGVTFFEVLTGRLPFPPSATGSDYEVRKGHIEIDPPMITALQPDVPTPLAGIIMRSLRKSPGERFQTAAEFLDAVLACDPGATGVVKTAPAPLETEVINPAPTAPKTPGPATSETTVPLLAQPPPVGSAVESVKPVPPPDRLPEPARPVRRTGRQVVPAIAAAVVLLSLAGGSYWLLRREREPARTAAAMTTPTVSPTSAAPPVRAQEYEAQERYPEAIALYDSFLRDNPHAAAAPELSARLAELKKFQGLLSLARLEFDREDYEAARRDYAEALKLRPASQLARTGLEEAEARLSRRPRP